MRKYVSDSLIHYECPVEYIGFTLLCDAICLACQNLVEINTNMKGIYVDIGKQRKMSRLSIERNLRTLVKVWATRPKFKELFDEVPTNASLIINLAHKTWRPNASVYDILLS